MFLEVSSVEGLSLTHLASSPHLEQYFVISLEDIYENPDNAYEWSSTGDAAQAEYERYQAWDDMLNEIYALLKTQLSSSEMKALKNEEINWINYRDKTAENDARDFEGGSNYSVVYNGSLANTTKDRCYELVNNYMK